MGDVSKPIYGGYDEIHDVIQPSRIGLGKLNSRIDIREKMQHVSDGHQSEMRPKKSKKNSCTSKCIRGDEYVYAPIRVCTHSSLN